MTAAKQQREDAGKRLEAELELALYHFRDAKRKVDLYRDTLVPKGRQSLDVARQGFEAGKVTFISLIDAQRLLLEFQLAERRARTNRGQRLAEIEMLSGKEVGTERTDGRDGIEETE
jgi:outer membrane protein TolC